MPIGNNMNKWMTIWNSFMHLKQMKETSDDDNSSKESSKKEQRKPGFTSWFTNEDECTWAEIFYRLGEDQQANVVSFLENLAPANPNTFAEKTAQKFNQAMFRKIVTGLTVIEARHITSQTTKGTGDKANVTKNYSGGARNSTDHRIKFLRWLSKSVATDGNEATRKKLAVANIISSDEAMESTMATLTKIINLKPKSFKKLFEHFSYANDNCIEKLRVFNICTSFLILPTIVGSYILWNAGHPIYSTITILLAVIAGVIGFQKYKKES